MFIALLVVFLILLVAAVFFAFSTNTTTTTTTTITTYSINTQNKFSITVKGDYLSYRSAIINASDVLSDIINDDVEIPLRINIISGSNGNSIASASINDRTNIFSGGVVNIYSDYSGNLTTTYTEILIHEYLHVMGIGSHNTWINAVNNGELDGSVFTNTLNSYNTIYGVNESNIPLGDNDAHWDEEVFDDEMMTPFVNGAVDLILSEITGNALIDLGWDIDLNSNSFEKLTP